MINPHLPFNSARLRLDACAASVYNGGMTIKEIAIQTLQGLPGNASWEDVKERINFVAGVRKGLDELDKGQGISHDKIKKEFAEWLTE